MTEKEIDELIELEDNSYDTYSINKKIKSQIRKQIYKRIIIVLIVVAIAWQGISRGTSYILDLYNYNPYNEVVFQELNKDIEIDGFEVLMSTAVSMCFPGKLYESGDKNKLGYGKYEVNAKIQEIFDPLYVDGTTNVKFNIQRSTLKYETSVNDMFTVSANEYYDENANEEYKTSVNDLGVDINDIKELPDSALLDVAISFPKTYTLKQVINYMKKYDNAKFVWLATNVQGQVANGMSIYDAFSYELDDESSKKYPNFYLWGEDIYNEDKLIQHYLSKLKLLKEHQEFVELVSSCFNISIDDINERYENVKNNGITCIGLRCYVKKQDLLTMIEKDNLKKVYVHDVRYSNLEK